MRCSLNSKLALGHCPSNYSKFNGKIWRFESILPADNNTLNYCGMIESTVGTGTQVMEVVNWGFEPFIVTMASSLDVALVIFFLRIVLLSFLHSAPHTARPHFLTD